MAACTGVLYVGFAGSPSIPSVIGMSGNLPYFVGASLALVAIFLVAIPKVAAPDFAEAAMESPLRFLHLAPVAIAATTLNAALEASGLSFLVGAIALQLPIGWFGDKWDRVRLVVCLAAAAAFVTVMGTKGGFP